MKTLNKLPQYLIERFYRCQGACEICMNEGDCKLENHIKRHSKERIKEIVYN